MARWAPDAAGRLQAAGIELFASRGFEEVTAAEIAAAAGVTERTFFRHYADKREVVFRGQDVFEATFVDAVRAAPSDKPPLGLIAAGLQALERVFTDERRPWSRLRQGVIAANPALQERERQKLAVLAAKAAAVLRDRGVDEPTATVAAELGSTVLGIAFVMWVAERETRPYGQLVGVVMAEVRALSLADGAG